MLKLSLATFAVIFGILKFIQFAFFTRSVWIVILNDFCGDKCLLEYSELVFIISTFIPLSLLVYGAVRVREKRNQKMLASKNVSFKFIFQLNQPCIGLWLVAHVILLAFDIYVQYEIRLSSNSMEYTTETVVAKSIEFSEFAQTKTSVRFLISFHHSSDRFDILLLTVLAERSFDWRETIGVVVWWWEVHQPLANKIRRGGVLIEFENKNKF